MSQLANTPFNKFFQGNGQGWLNAAGFLGKLRLVFNILCTTFWNNEDELEIQ